MKEFMLVPIMFSKVVTTGIQFTLGFHETPVVAGGVSAIPC